MRFLRRASSFLNSLRDSGSSGSEVVSKAIFSGLKTGIVPIIVIAGPVLLLIIVFLTIFLLFNYKIDLMQMVDSGSSVSFSTTGVDLNYDFDDYIKIMDASSYGSPNAESVLSSKGSSVDEFNKHLKEMIDKAGFGTREGVVAAAVGMTGEYTKITGQRIPYSNMGRQQPGSFGIVNKNSMYFDCSGFSWSTLYNGGFKLPPIVAQTASIYPWAVQNNMVKGMTDGKPGDFLITTGQGHIMVIVGNFDGGYYIAESNVFPWGNRIVKFTYEQVSRYSYGVPYVVIDMTSYYNSNNVRQG